MVFSGCVRTIASIFTMLYKPRMAEVAEALGAVGDDRALPFGWAMRVSETHEVDCRDVLDQLTDEELGRVATLWRMVAWEDLPRNELVKVLCDGADREAAELREESQVRRDPERGRRAAREG